LHDNGGAGLGAASRVVARAPASLLRVAHEGGLFVKMAELESACAGTGWVEMIFEECLRVSL
jgi:hypothetical protein